MLKKDNYVFRGVMLYVSRGVSDQDNYVFKGANAAYLWWGGESLAVPDQDDYVYRGGGKLNLLKRI